MKKERYKRDSRVSFWQGVFYEFIMVFFIIFINGYGLIMIYNSALRAGKEPVDISIMVVLYLLFGCLVSTLLVYFTRARIYSQNLRQICAAAQRVANGDFSVRLEVYEDKVGKTEIDILKEDFNKMVEELTSIERMRDDFIADVSHEIKTPLSVIQGYADLLQGNGISDEKRAEYIKLISEAIHSLTELVGNVLKLNKIENQGIIQCEKYSLSEQVRESILLYEQKLEDKSLTLDLDIDEIEIKNDKALLEIVWNNLIGNAVKFSNYGGTVAVSVKKENEQTVVAVSDDGCGMSEKILKRIFDKFYQGDISHSGEGNGLGLAMVRQVVDKIGADITVESKLGEGSSFKVII